MHSPRLVAGRCLLRIVSSWDRLRTGRVRILWLVLGAMLLVSAVPIGLYHRQVLQLSQEKLVDTELVQQADLTRSLAREIQLFEANLTQQLVSERQIMALMGLSDNVEDPVGGAQSHATAGELRRQQSRNFSVSDGGRQDRQRHGRIAGKFPGGPGSFRGQGLAARICGVDAIAEISQRSSGAWRPTTGRPSSSRCR